jgi:uncharacterized PurR-regulated membrane protein YhhQ (DUF165 family)
VDARVKRGVRCWGERDAQHSVVAALAAGMLSTIVTCCPALAEPMPQVSSTALEEAFASSGLGADS